MKQSLPVSIAALLLLTAILAAVHLTTRTPEIEGEICINGESVAVSSLPTSPVTGSIVNGRGEETKLDTAGIALSDVASGDVTVTASDEYSAYLSADELKNAYLIFENGSLRLVVFGDENAKRDVKNVSRIDFR